MEYDDYTLDEFQEAWDELDEESRRAIADSLVQEREDEIDSETDAYLNYVAQQIYAAEQQRGHAFTADEVDNFLSLSAESEDGYVDVNSEFFYHDLGDSEARQSYMQERLQGDGGGSESYEYVPSEGVAGDAWTEAAGDE
jgi:hypothetical protein